MDSKTSSMSLRVVETHHYNQREEVGVCTLKDLGYSNMFSGGQVSKYMRFSVKNISFVEYN